MRRAVVALAAVVAAAVLLGGGGGGAAAQAADSRAAVIVDLGGGDVRSACVLFRGDSITGLELLRAAQMDPVVRGYSGEGGAVCKLCGKGCSDGSDCLTCLAPSYWQYWRAPEGDERFQYSNVGAGTAKVADGDLDAWRWGSDKTSPLYRTVESICDAGPVYRAESTPTPSTTTSPPGPSTTTAPPPLPPPTNAAVPTSARALTRSNATTTLVVGSATLPPATSSTVASTTTTTELRQTAAAEPDDPDDPSSPWPGLAALTVLLGGLAAWSVRMRAGRGNLR